MHLEIEMKAHVRNKAAVEKALSGIATRVRDFFKSDSYYLFPNSKPTEGRTFRIRRDSSLEPGKAILTWKERSKVNGLEVNRENEFVTDSAAEIVSLSLAMGAKAYFTKQKSGSEWSLEPFCIELVDVSPLGTFLEIETLVDSAGEMDDAQRAQRADEARQGILAIFESCGLGESDIEERYYSQMMRESGALEWKPDQDRA